MLNIKKLSLFIAVTSISAPALAQEMRCGTHLISGNQTRPLIKEQVLEMCGAPTEKDYERWYYKEQHMILVFDGNGELDHIEKPPVTND